MFTRENYRFDFLALILNVGETQVTLESVDYGPDPEKNRSIPKVSGESYVCVIWGVQYMNPAADPDREVVWATWAGGNVYNIQRAMEGSLETQHFIGDNIAMLCTTALVSEVLVFEDFLMALLGSIGYIDDVDGVKVVQALPPDNEVSVPEGYQKILVTDGVSRTGKPYWQFAFAEEVGAQRQAYSV